MVVATEKIEALEEFRPQMQRLRKSAAAALRRRPRPKTSDWASETVRLSNDYEATSGPVDLTDRPWWREVLDACNDPDVETVDIMAGTQVGKTLQSLIAALAMSDIAPVPGMIVTPDFTSCMELRDRLYALAEASPRLRNRVPRETDRNMRHVDLKTCRIYLAYSGARQRLRGRPCGWVFLTEIDVYRGDKKGGDPLAAAGERVKAFFRFKIVRESSPGDDPSPIAKLYDNSDARTWQCRCPHCGKHQEVRFFPLKSGAKAGCGGIAGYRHEDGRLKSIEEARRDAYYVCVKGCQISNAEKGEFLRSGKWVPRGQYLDDSGKLCGTPDRPGRARGYHLWSIMSPTQNFGTLAASYVDHYHKGQLADFRKNWLGLPHTNQAKMPLWNKLGERLGAYHLRGTVPAEAWFITSGIDVQEDRVVWSVRAWGDQITSWLVDWGIFQRQADEDENLVLKSDLRQLERLLRTRWPVVNAKQQPTKSPFGLDRMGILLAGIDSNYRVLDVHNWLRSLEEETGRLIRALRGDHHLDPKEPYRRNVLYESQRDGTKYEGGLEQWGVFVNTFKQDLAERFIAPRGPGAFYFTADVLIHGEDYLKQLVNEPRVETRLPNGKRKVEWKEKNHHIGHDWWDTEVYNRALAQMRVDELGIGWDATQWSRKKFAAPPASVADYSAPIVVARDEYGLTN